jgi:ketosteroid isomerase-like protein
MPWFPDFANAAALARIQTREAARADPAVQYLNALSTGDTHDLNVAWPGEVVVYDPRAGEIRGHHQLRKFVGHNHDLFAARHARVETVASTSADGRAVLELLVHLSTEDGAAVDWPIAVVAESPDDLSVVFRTYCSQWPVDQQRPVRPAFLPPGDEQPGDVVARYEAALESGDVEAMVGVFAPDGYYREPIGPHAIHHGAAEIRAYFKELFSNGGVGLQNCAVTDDGVRCALEYNCIRRGDEVLRPQAGLAVYERGADGQLTAARMYDDIDPSDHGQS